ncbi:Porphobilinogen deaminase [hydrothermal vent metagenome]|uniref:hydroxymethylbilane synthase n=1 Tax=hydrothermal vent metagenome TaxID=652676 RepID=A0A3B1CDL9_9ZZZZ
MADFKIGTRGSPLALWQANFVKASLEKEYSGIIVELEIIHTQGDKILDTPLAMIGGKGLFVKELETALLDGRVDIAVHSMKDVPTELPNGLEISIILEREDPRDALISKSVKSFADLPQGARVGTSSLRRQAQILSKRPDINIISIRGNVGTRIGKIEKDNLDGVILAAAGLKRMKQDDLIAEYLSQEDSLPAVAQGAMGIESRVNDKKVLDIINFLNHKESRITVETERAFLKRLEGGCQVPIAGHATLKEDVVSFEGLVGAVDGSTIFRDVMTAPVGEHEAMGVALAEKILSKGGGEILENFYGNK